MFLIIREGDSKIQAVLFSTQEEESNTISIDTKTNSIAMIKYARQIPHETIVDIYGMIKTVDNSIKRVTSIATSTTTNQDVEIVIKRIHTISPIHANHLPFEIDDASRSEHEIKQSENNTIDNNSQSKDKKNSPNSNEKIYRRVGQNIRLDNRWIDMRTAANKSIFSIRSGVSKCFRQYLLSQDFIEIHTPKLISKINNGSNDSFKLLFFGNDAFLARSTDLYKQMTLCGDFEKVFEIGPVFRQEYGNTHRHLCEFTCLDFEMEFKEHYHEVLNIIGDMFNYIFNSLNKYYKNEINAVRKQYPFEDLLYHKKMLILTFTEAHNMIKEYYLNLLKNGSQDAVEAARNLLFQEGIYIHVMNPCAVFDGTYFN